MYVRFFAIFDKGGDSVEAVVPASFPPGQEEGMVFSLGL